MAAIDHRVVTRIAASAARIDNILDLGVSSGTTTIELIEALRRAGYRPAVTATDRTINARLVPLRWGCSALVEPGGHVLQYDVLGAPIRPWRRRLDYLTGFAAVGGLTERLLGPQLAGARNGKSVTLVSPHLARMPGVSLVEDDVTVCNPRLVGQFDLVRAANLLNKHYFSRESMAAAAANVRRYLRGSGAFLLLLRTHNARDHHGSLLRMEQDGQLEVIERFGRGSEVEALFTTRA